MRFAKPTIIFGILLAIALIPVTYLTLVLAIALAFGGNAWFGYVMYAFGIMVIATIVGVCLTKKCIIATRIIYSITTILLIAVTIFLMSSGLDTDGILLYLFYGGVSVLGGIATLFAFLARKKEETMEMGNNL